MRKKSVIIMLSLFLVLIFSNGIFAESGLTQKEQNSIIKGLSNEEKLVCGTYDENGYELLDIIKNGEQSYQDIIDENMGFSKQSIMFYSMKGASGVSGISKTFNICKGYIKNAHVTCKYKKGSTYLYCMDPTRTDPSSGTSYTEKSLSDFKGKHTGYTSGKKEAQKKGLVTLIMKGFPTNTDFKKTYSLSDSEAAYVTQNALRAYMSESGMFDSYAKSSHGTSKYSQNSSHKNVYKAYTWLKNQAVNAYKNNKYPTNSSVKLKVTPTKLTWKYDSSTKKLKSSVQKVTYDKVDGASAVVTFPASWTCKLSNGKSIKSGDKLSSGAKLTFYANVGTKVTSGTAKYNLKYTKYTYSNATFYSPKSNDYQPMLVANLRSAWENKEQKSKSTLNIGKLEITKTDGSNGKLNYKNVMFNLLDSAGNKMSVDGTNGSYKLGISKTSFSPNTKTGKITISNLPYGTWYLQEVKTDEANGYILNSNKIKFVVSSSGTLPKNENFENYATNLTVLKKDSKTGDGLKGAVFQIRNSSGTLMTVKKESDGVYSYKKSGEKTIESGSNGKINVKGLPLGEYKLIEISPPNEYAIIDEVTEFEISKDTGYNAEVEIENIRTDLYVYKKDEKTKELLDTAEFKLSDETGATVGFSKVRDGVYTYGGSIALLTTKNGLLKVLGLPINEKFILEETKAPRKYIVTESKKYEVYLTEKTSTQTINIDNLLTSITVEKKDKDTHSFLDGATFSIYDKEDNVVGFTYMGAGRYIYGGTETVLDKYSGKFSVYALPLGDYKVKEITPPKYYKLDEESQKEVTITKEDNEVKAEFLNEPNLVTFYKKDSETKELIDTVTINIFDNETDKKIKFVEIEKGVYEYKAGKGDTYDLVSADGKIQVRALDDKKTYYALEVTPPDSFIMESKEKKVFTPNVTKDVEIDMFNIPTALKLIKYDGYLGTIVEGLDFSIYDKDLNKLEFVLKDNIYYPVIDDKLQGSKTDILTTDENGEILVYYLPKGKYTVKEIKALAGYTKMKDLVVEVDENSSIDYPATYSMYNYKAYGSLRVEHRFDSEILKIPEIKDVVIDVENDIDNTYVIKNDSQYDIYDGNIMMNATLQGTKWQVSRLNDEYLKLVDKKLKEENPTLKLYEKGTLHFDHVEIMTDFNGSEKTGYSVTKPKHLITKHHYPLDGKERVYNSTDEVVDGKYASDMNTIVFYYGYDVEAKNDKKTSSNPSYKTIEDKIETNNPKTGLFR